METHMKTMTLLALTSLLVGCSDKSEDSGGTDFQPLAGTWTYENLSYDTDECDFESDFPVSILEAVQLTMALTDTGYSMSSTLTDEPVECTLTGMDYSCTMSSSTEQTAWTEDSSNTGDPDATTSAVGSVSGTFSDAETASFFAQMDYSCEGADCDAYVADMGISAPCSSSVSADMVRIGD